MLPPLELESPTIELPWLHYNSPSGWPAFGDTGAQEVPAVVHCAWRNGADAAVVFVNVDRAEHEVRVPVNTRTLRLDSHASYELTRIDGVERTPIGSLSADGGFVIALPPRKVVVVEATPLPGL
jgi:hypothetical protein